MRYGLLIAALVLAAVAWLLLRSPPAKGETYPSAYLTALDTSVGVAVEDAHFEPFISFVQNMSASDWDSHFDAVYAEALHFSDTLTVVRDRATLRAYFEQLHEAGTVTQVNILARHQVGQDGYLVWEMRSRFKPIGSEKLSHTIGMTHLRFNHEGRVVLQQDFWDSAQGFYQHLPLLGQAIIGIRERLQPAER